MTEEDTVYWGLNKSTTYSTNSMYKWLEKPLSGSSYKWIWEAKLPLKIQIFLWGFKRLCLMFQEAGDEAKEVVW